MKTQAKTAGQLLNPILFTFALCVLGLDVAGQAQPTWQTVTIPGLPTGSTLASVWARSRNEAYVWASLSGASSLYRWNGSQWYKVLDAPDAPALKVAVYGVGTSEVFAASSSQIWRSTNNGQTWAVQTLPSFQPPLFDLSGTPNNIHVCTSDGQIIRFNGTTWASVYTNTGQGSPGPLYVPSANEGYYVTCWGWGSWNGSQWAFHGVQFDFCDLYATWWTRDGDGNLHWYAVGNENFANGIRVWKFDTNCNCFGGKCNYVFSDGGTCDSFGGPRDLGNAYAVWGSAADDVYVGGALASFSGGPRTGRLYHYDGVTWSQVTAFGTISQVSEGGIAGTARDDVWVSLVKDAKLLHYAPIPPVLDIHMYAGLTISGQVGATYQIQYTSNLNSPTNWVALTNLTLPTSPYLYFDTASSNQPTRFYRALLVQ